MNALHDRATCLIRCALHSVDPIRYAQDVESEVGAGDEETGWKLVHGDVFR
jgi:hypothetical protein